MIDENENPKIQIVHDDSPPLAGSQIPAMQPIKTPKQTKADQTTEKED